MAARPARPGRCPFADRFWRVAPRVRGDDLQAVLQALHAEAPGAAGASKRLPHFVATSTPLADEMYELWTLDFNLGKVVAALEAQTGDASAPMMMLEGATTTELWMRWVPDAWPCGDATGNATAAPPTVAAAAAASPPPPLAPSLAVVGLGLSATQEAAILGALLLVIAGVLWVVVKGKTKGSATSSTHAAAGVSLSAATEAGASGGEPRSSMTELNEAALAAKAQEEEAAAEV